MNGVWLFREEPESISWDADGNPVGLSVDGVETPLDLSCSVRSVKINAAHLWPDGEADDE